MSIFKSKKFKYGTYAVAFICAFIALVIALNLFVTLFDEKYDWRFDLTENHMYSLSDETDKALRIALGDKYSAFDITITFCASRDLFEYYDAQRGDADKYYSSVRDIAEEYASLYDGTDGKGKVTVRYVDITSDPAEANRLKQQARLDIISWKNIIVQNSANTEYYRVLGFDAFYKTDSETGSLYAFQAENKFTAAIIQCVAAENITVGFTTGHGESHSKALEEIFTLSTLNCVELDLKSGDIPDEVKIIVISDPKYDFTYGNNGEIDKISDFMSEKETYNSLIVLVNAETPDLPNLRDYLWEGWGMDYEPNHKITDENASLQGSNFEDIVASYSSVSDTTVAGALIGNAKKAGLPTVFPNCVSLKADTTGNRKQYVDVAMSSSKNSVVTYEEDGELITRSGSFPVAIIATVHEYANDDVQSNSNKYQYVLLLGSTEFAGDKYLNNTYGNEDVMYAATRAMATDRVALDIRIKKLADNALTLESGKAKTLMIVITCALPAIIVIIGIAVFFRRRHK